MATTEWVQKAGQSSATEVDNINTLVEQAETAATNAENAYNSFSDKYLGDKASDPTLDNDGDALVVGALYYNTTSDKIKVYNGSAWQDVAPTATSVTVSQISDLTATATELNYVDGVTSNIQTQLDGKGTGTVSTLADLSITATAAELNTLDGITATVTELNYTDGVTSAIQTQLDAKAPSASPTFTGDVTFSGAIDEAVYALSGTTPAIDPANGTIQTWTLSGNSTPTDSLSEGESVTLMIDDGTAYTITWPTTTWVNNGGSAPTLATTGYTVIALWKVSTTLYGALVGDGS